MKKAFSIFVFTALALFTHTSFADSVIGSTDSFQSIQKMISSAAHPEHWLVVIDDDDTLTRMPCVSENHCQYLGGVAWFNWQAAMKPDNPARVARSFPDLVRVTDFLLSTHDAPLTESDIPATLTLAHQRGVHILVLTARGSELIPATERQFSQDGILSLVEKDAPQSPVGQISFAGDYLPAKIPELKTNRPIAYQDGILYVAGQNKGFMLKGFLEKMHDAKQFTHLVFLDDTFQNVKDVASVYKNTKNVQVISLHYLRMQKHKAAFLTGKNAKKLQAEAT
ncbi:MAG TPA: DUF2608 domain-containing protein, partial [Coxiellaceae bacterium]|nr:DUF2608 domain-containing protein [Coxiellaceae bacterium]